MSGTKRVRILRKYLAFSLTHQNCPSTLFSLNMVNETTKNLVSDSQTPGNFIQISKKRSFSDATKLPGVSHSHPAGSARTTGLRNRTTVGQRAEVDNVEFSLIDEESCHLQRIRLCTIQRADPEEAPEQIQKKHRTRSSSQ